MILKNINMKLFTRGLLLGFSFALFSCGIYTFTGGNTGDAKTIQVDYFYNNAPIVEPSLSQTFTQDLRDLFVRQTNLSLVTADGDLQFEGEVIRYMISPSASTANQTAAQSRLTIGVKVRFFNELIPEDNFEKNFSFFYDFDAQKNVSEVKDDAYKIIFERITQDIFNASVAKW